MFFLKKTINSLKIPKIKQYIFYCLIWSIIFLGTIVGVITIGSSILIDINIAGFKYLNYFLNSIIPATIGIFSGYIGWFFLPIIFTFISGIYQSQIIDQIEKFYYSSSKSVTVKNKFWPELKHDLKFLLWSLFLNVLITPFYFLSIGPIISISLNTYLLGREFFESVVGNYKGKEKAKELRKDNFLLVYIGGFIFTLCSLIPFVQFLTPVIGVIWMMHAYYFIVKKNNH